MESGLGYEDALAEAKGLGFESLIIETVRKEILRYWARTDGADAAQFALGEPELQSLRAAMTTSG